MSDSLESHEGTDGVRHPARANPATPDPATADQRGQDFANLLIPRLRLEGR